MYLEVEAVRIAVVTQGEGVAPWHERARNAVVSVNPGPEQPTWTIPGEGPDGWQRCGNGQETPGQQHVCAKAHSAAALVL